MRDFIHSRNIVDYEILFVSDATEGDATAAGTADGGPCNGGGEPAGTPVAAGNPFFSGEYGLNVNGADIFTEILRYTYIWIFRCSNQMISYDFSFCFTIPLRRLRPRGR